MTCDDLENLVASVKEKFPNLTRKELSVIIAKAIVEVDVKKDDKNNNSQF